MPNHIAFSHSRAHNFHALGGAGTVAVAIAVVEMAKTHSQKNEPKSTNTNHSTPTFNVTVVLNWEFSFRDVIAVCWLVSFSAQLRYGINNCKYTVNMYKMLITMKTFWMCTLHIVQPYQQSIRLLQNSFRPFFLKILFLVVAYTRISRSSLALFLFLSALYLVRIKFIKFVFKQLLNNIPKWLTWYTTYN